MLGLIARVVVEFKNASWVFGGSGPSFEELVPGYVVFLAISIILSVLVVKSYGFKHAKFIILISWIIILSLTFIDIGKDCYYEVSNYYGEVQVSKLKHFYETKDINGLKLQEVIWYSDKQTVYLFVKYEEVSKYDIDNIIKTIKPVDNLDITIQLISYNDKKQLIYRYSNQKKFISIEHDKLLESLAEGYLK